MYTLFDDKSISAAKKSDHFFFSMHSGLISSHQCGSLKHLSRRQNGNRNKSDSKSHVLQLLQQLSFQSSFHIFSTISNYSISIFLHSTSNIYSNAQCDLIAVHQSGSGSSESESSGSFSLHISHIYIFISSIASSR